MTSLFFDRDGEPFQTAQARDASNAMLAADDAVDQAQAASYAAQQAFLMAMREEGAS